MKVWVVTREENQYDQYGEYFECVFANKPTKQQLVEYILANEWKCGARFPDQISAYIRDVSPAQSPAEFLADHLLKGGGRVDSEDTWWHLREEECM